MGEKKNIKRKDETKTRHIDITKLSHRNASEKPRQNVEQKRDDFSHQDKTKSICKASSRKERCKKQQDLQSVQEAKGENKTIVMQQLCNVE